MEYFLWFDIITLGLILLLAIKGVINGFIKEVFGLIGIVGGIYLASRYAKIAGQWVDVNLFAFENKSALFLIGFLAVLICFWIVSILLGYIFAKMLSLSGLGIVDKLAGFLVGGAKIFFIFSVLFLAISNVDFVQEKLQKYLKNSFMYPTFIRTGAFIVNLKPNLNLQTSEIDVLAKKVNDKNKTKLSISIDQNISDANGTNTIK